MDIVIGAPLVNGVNYTQQIFNLEQDIRELNETITNLWNVSGIKDALINQYERQIKSNDIKFEQLYKKIEAVNLLNFELRQREKKDKKSKK
tara:strand:+ start:114 stop:386 length:273 start_codon:yes stop_codon:yes gene_type:complete